MLTANAVSPVRHHARYVRSLASRVRRAAVARALAPRGKPIPPSGGYLRATVPPLAALPRAPFEITPEQEEIRRTCRDFAAKEIRPISLAVDEADAELPREVWDRAAEIGLTSFMLPERLGGGGMTDCLTGCIVQEELSHGCAGIGNLITSNGFFAEPVLALGSDDQQRRWLEPLTGERPPLTALAATEPDAGSDVASMRTTARRS